MAPRRERVVVMEGLAPMDRVGVGVGVGVGELVKVQVDETEGLAPGERDGVGVWEGELVSVDVEEKDGLAPGERDGVGVCVGLLVRVEVEEELALAPWDTEAVGVEVGLPLSVLVEELLPLAPCVSEDVGVCVPLPVPLAASVLLPLLLALPLRLTVGVAEGEAPRDSEAVGDSETEELPEAVVLGVPVCEPVCVPVGDAVEEPDRDTLAVALGEAPDEREAVGEALCVLLALVVEEGVGAGLPVALLVGLTVRVGVDVSGGVALLVRDMDAVTEALAPGESEDVGLMLRVLLPESVLLGVAALVPLLDGVGLPVLVALGVGGGVAEPERLVEAELEEEAPRVREAVGLLDTVVLPETVEDGVIALVPVPLVVALPVPVGEGVTGGVAEPERLLEPVVEALTPRVRDAVGLEEVVLLALTLELAVMLPVPEELLVGEPVGV
jgi:hypothetical protein